MRKDWLMAAGLGIVVVACFEKADDDDEDEDEDEDDGGSGGGVGGGVGGGSGGSGGGGSLDGLAAAFCDAYDDCGLLEEYFTDYETCLATALSTWESYGYCASSGIDQCISTINSTGCDYLYDGSEDCYYALEEC